MTRQVVEMTLYRVGGESIEIDTTGDTGSGYLLVQGAEGLGEAPVSSASAPRVAAGGSIFRGSRLDERELFLPLLVEGTDEADYLDRLDRLARVTSPLAPGDLVLRVRPVHRETYRELVVHYAGGLDGAGDTYQSDWGVVGLKLKSFEALWSGQPERTTRQVEVPFKPFLSTTVPFFPVVLADSSVQGRLVVDVRGDAPTWPIWTITPPGSDLLLSMLGGPQFFLSGALTEPVTINMATGTIVSPSSPAGMLWDRVAPDKGALFQLTPGRNVLSFSMVGASSASEIEVIYRPQYLRGV